MIPYVGGGGIILICSLVEDRSVKVGNAKCLLDPLVGIPFGSVFEVQSGPNGHVLVRLQHPITESKEKESIESEEAVERMCRDNRALIDNNTAQTLSAEDIEQMRREGATGKAIIEALVANSASFEAKSAFSQVTQDSPKTQIISL
jgi:tRNA (adenine-N(1)-)-methyltransferase non-catalytic subunit